MSVVASKRTLSDREFFHNAIKIRKEITLLLLRDFGIKDKVRTLRSFTDMKKMSDTDRGSFEYLSDKYHFDDKIVEEYPEWLISKFRDEVMDILHLLILNITYANSIYPTNMSEYEMRRGYQNKSIGNCYQLLQQLQYIISVIPVDANKYMVYTEMVEKEIQYLKDWRKEGNKLKSKFN